MLGAKRLFPRHLATQRRFLCLLKTFKCMVQFEQSEKILYNFTKSKKCGRLTSYSDMGIFNVRVVVAPNLRCARIFRICMRNPNYLALIVSEISAFIRMGIQTDGQMVKNICTL